MSRYLGAHFSIDNDGVVKRNTLVNLHGPMSSLLQDRSPFMSAGFFYCGFRVERLDFEP
jgi:hypothetical protein